MKVSLVATVKDAGSEIGPFLDSLRAQTRPPDEVVVVDGGSTDGTLEALRGAEEITLLEEPGANIPRGRNVAVAAATHDVIAVTDADCVLAPDWLERLVAAMERGADVAMGFYRPLATGLFQATVAAVTLPEAEEVNPARFLPSSRSVAFTRDVFEEAGRYPEWLDIGEDMYLNHRLRDLGARMDFVPEAVVFWRVRPTVATTWDQFFRYARGDAIAGMHPERHAVRFTLYGLLAWALATRRRGLLAMLGIAAAAHAGRRVPRAVRLLPGRPRDRIAAAALMPAQIVLADLAKMAGFVAGHLAKRGGRRG